MTSYQIVLVERGGNLKEKKTKNIDALYKVCNYRNDNHFSMQTNWDVSINSKKYQIQLWAKNDGKAGTENKYDFPPPIDKELYFGTCCLICYENDKPSNLSISLWKQIYEKLFGGFEDLGNESDEDTSEDSMDEHETTKQGYSKEDNFVVSDDEECDIYDEDELIEEECSDTDDDE